jgi:hypothetical protein
MSGIAAAYCQLATQGMCRLGRNKSKCAHGLKPTFSNEQVRPKQAQALLNTGRNADHCGDIRIRKLSIIVQPKM